MKSPLPRTGQRAKYFLRYHLCNGSPSQNDPLASRNYLFSVTGENRRCLLLVQQRCSGMYWRLATDCLAATDNSLYSRKRRYLFPSLHLPRYYTFVLAVCQVTTVKTVSSVAICRGSAVWVTVIGSITYRPGRAPRTCKVMVQVPVGKEVEIWRAL